MKLTPLREVIRREFGAREFWKQYGAMWYRARKAGRAYLTWEEWDHALKLAERFEMFAYYQGGRDGRKDEDIRSSDFVHVAGSTILFLAFRRMKRARAAGISPWQFALEEDRRVDGIRTTEREVHELEIARAHAARRSAEEARRGHKKRTRSDDRDDSLPLPQ